jgi:hypothetical protein
MSIELKIKSKHLSLEAKVIRFEERKLAKQIKWLERNEKPTVEVCWKLSSLSDHRKSVVGRENRATFLARAFIAGYPYTRAEKSRRDDKHWEFNVKILPRVLEMVKKYHPDYKVRREITLDTLKDWCIL